MVETLKILNCVFDEKFIDGLIKVMDFTSTNGISNEYVWITDEPPVFKYIKQSGRIQHIKEDEFLPYLIKGEYNVLIAHSIHSIKAKILQNIPKSVKVVWAAWGTDIYSYPTNESPLVKLQLYRKKTSKAIALNFIGWLQKKHGYLDYLLHRSEIRRSISRIDYFSGVIPSEYCMMTHNPWFRAKEVRFNYFNLNHFISEENKFDDYYVGENILIGNSGDPTNNHLDAFDILSRNEIGNKKVYVSLSYGGSEHYRNAIKTIGKNLFGSNLNVLDTFMPYQEYCKIIASCGYVIMYHERQQGMGNITAALWNGCKVYLSETSEVYLMYKKLGAHIFSIQNDLYENGCVGSLSYEEVIKNREILIATMSSKVLLDNIYKMYALIKKDMYEN